jgi:hypothetical protein
MKSYSTARENSQTLHLYLTSGTKKKFNLQKSPKSTKQKDKNLLSTPTKNSEKSKLKIFYYSINNLKLARKIKMKKSHKSSQKNLKKNLNLPDSLESRINKHTEPKTLSNSHKMLISNSGCSPEIMKEPHSTPPITWEYSTTLMIKLSN